ncbi:alpha/beta hydrolase [Photobacterium gaetbulicola]|uniref:Putative prolyl aminopeptidase n=1 Tax=Photobacterium gaetbulicola Gung47 TaxID=658445 RepID=A0A0C5WJS6_9GAMM|nr:alpha/beta fold hydrolase [Photobacterium gaetbulicola]AJR05354.1 putative prolyl aminopeptidase [Photobacterium gaetbulicola Gung47]PSU12679.1 alpha/beta hydrolase [Photobacterium gaetbulicola]
MQTSFIDGDVLYRQHTFEVPLDYSQPNAQTISVFAREVVDLGRQDDALPWLVYFQGGPGFASPRPDCRSGWLKRALKQYRVLLLDQRGTGNSTVISHQTLAHLSASEQADYLSLFRADNIVRDAETIRVKLGVKQWATLGQSFGGFCSLTYLSFFPQSLSRAYITGGVPSLIRHADEVYQATYQRVQDKNVAFFVQFPSAQAQCQKIADHLLDNDVRLPNGQRFTVEQFQMIGINLGRSSANVPMYYLLEEAFVEANGKETLSYGFLNAMLAEQSYQTNPIYAILHESIYCQHTASNWSAHRVRDSFPQFNYHKGETFYFTGEMVYPWMFEQFKCLQPLQDAANLLAERTDWNDLYDVKALANNTVPVACAVYAEDMYVEMQYSLETLKEIPNSKAWITNEYEHNGLRADGERILDRLIQLADSVANLP